MLLYCVLLCTCSDWSCASCYSLLCSRRSRGRARRPTRPLLSIYRSMLYPGSPYTSSTALYYSLHLPLVCAVYTQQPYAVSSGGPLRHLSHMRVQTFRASTNGSGVSAFSHIRLANLSWSPDWIVSCVSASTLCVGASRLSICSHRDGTGGGTGSRIDCPLCSRVSTGLQEHVGLRTSGQGMAFALVAARQSGP